MMRVTGFLAGVGLTIAAFVLILNSGDPAAEEPAAVVEAGAENVAVVQAGNEPDQAVAPDPESGRAGTEPQSGFLEPPGDGIAEAFSQASTVMVAQADHESGTADAQPPHSLEQSAPEQDDHPNGQGQADDSDREEAVQPRTHLFWSPFRSAWAAQGFASRLTASTQVPVEVVNAGPGNYRVAFNYQDESERLARIERIETITGLELE